MALAAARFCLATSPLLSPIGAIHAHTLRSIFAWCMRSITSSMYCSTRCQFISVCLALAYWVSLFPSFFSTLRGGARLACDVRLHALPFHKVRSVARDVMGPMLFDEYQDAGVTQVVLNARVIGSALYQLRSTFDGLE
ncbi:hypothetical protein EDB89DRAFT_1957829 [Lactarius sanguifluus]|nr:hypothetical protein EDB89DRAFT_1957829 [Lactarius sanguifluus]